MGLGYLTFEIRTANGDLPVDGAIITVSDLSGNVLLNTNSDLNGNTEVFPFEAPDRALSLNKDEIGLPYAEYNVEVGKEGFNKINVYHVNIFDGEESILPVVMHPDTMHNAKFTMHNEDVRCEMGDGRCKDNLVNSEQLTVNNEVGSRKEEVGSKDNLNNTTLLPTAATASGCRQFGGI